MENNTVEYWLNKGDEFYDSKMFEEAAKCYGEAAKVTPNNVSAYNNWGNALSDLAIFKKDEVLHRKAIKKYEKATQLDPSNAPAYNNWGTALSNLAKIKKDEALYEEAYEKYEKATQLDSSNASAYYNWGIALYELGKINNQNELFNDVTICFKQSGKSILNILVLLDEETREDIIKTKILYPLLDPDIDSDDSNFFRETTKSIKNEKVLNKCKYVYILSIYIISQLYVDNENERIVAHYQKRYIAQKMLFDNVKFRLNAINYSNDPTEGMILFDYLFEKGKYREGVRINAEYGVFAGCFTFNCDSLNQFRLYGKEDNKEGMGLSLIFRNNFFSDEPKMAMAKRNIFTEITRACSH